MKRYERREVDVEPKVVLNYGVDVPDVSGGLTRAARRRIGRFAMAAAALVFATVIWLGFLAFWDGGF